MGLLKSSKPFLLASQQPAVPPHPLEVEGQSKLADYSIKRHLGKGNCATVKEALHIPSNTLCALKVISKRSIPNFSPELSRGRLLREMTILNGISHPNIIRVRDAFQTQDAYYIALELATGGVLFDRIAPSGRFTEKDAAVLLYSLVDALALLHDHDICHRDLKPDNIMFKTKAQDSQIMVMDFGVACTVRGDELLRTNIVGTPRYSSPEILHQRPHGKPCDMWSVGCIAYTLLCGFNPFHEAKTFPEIKQLVMQPVPFPQRYWANISPNALGFISRCLTPDPDERLTARQALVHPWFVQFVDAARQVAKSILAVAPLDSTVINLDVTHLSDSAPPDMDNPFPMANQLAQIVTAVPEALTTGIEIVDIPPDSAGATSNPGSTAASPARVYSNTRLSSMAVDIPRNSTHPRLVSLMSMSHTSTTGVFGGHSVAGQSNHQPPHRVMTTTHQVAALGHSWKSNASGGHSPGQLMMNLHVSPSAVFRVDVQAGVEAPPVADEELPNLAEEVWDVAAGDAAQGSKLGDDDDDEEEEEEDGLVMIARKKTAPVAVPGGGDAEHNGNGHAAETGKSAGSQVMENYSGLVVMPEETVVMSDVTVAGLDLAANGNGKRVMVASHAASAEDVVRNGKGNGLGIVEEDKVEEGAVDAEDAAGKWMRFSFLGRRTMLKKKK